MGASPTLPRCCYGQRGVADDVLSLVNLPPGRKDRVRGGPEEAPSGLLLVPGRRRWSAPEKHITHFHPSPQLYQKSAKKKEKKNFGFYVLLLLRYFAHLCSCFCVLLLTLVFAQPSNALRNSYMEPQTPQNHIYGHTHVNTLRPVRFGKLSTCWRSQYYGGGPHGNTACCRFSFFFFPAPTPPHSPV